MSNCVLKTSLISNRIKLEEYVGAQSSEWTTQCLFLLFGCVLVCCLLLCAVFINLVFKWLQAMLEYDSVIAKQDRIKKNQYRGAQPQ